MAHSQNRAFQYLNIALLSLFDMPFSSVNLLPQFLEITYSRLNKMLK